MKTTQMQSELLQLGNGAHALATQLLGNPDDAADIVHDSFAAVLMRPEAFDASKASLKTWFLRIVRNRCTDLMRKRKDVEPDLDGLVDPGAGPEQTFAQQQTDKELHQALGRLSAGQREIIVLRDYLDTSYADIASILEIAPGTVMSRLHRARLALKNELTRDGETL